MVGVGLRSATLSVHSLCSSSREGGCIKPVQIHFFKAVLLRLCNLNPARPAKVKLCERDKGSGRKAQLQYATHTLTHTHCTGGYTAS